MSLLLKAGLVLIKTKLGLAHLVMVQQCVCPVRSNCLASR